MAFELKPLGFDQADLEPYMSRETVHYHYDKHHKGYVDKLNAQLTPSHKGMGLEDMVISETGKLFNNAAQVWNHDFFWQSLSVDQALPTDKTFNSLILDSFGSLEELYKTYKDVAMSQFGSGWAWLVYNHHRGCMECIATANADSPLRGPQTPLLTLDVWEHAYYIDYRNEREKYVDTFLDHLINWSFVFDNTQVIVHPSHSKQYA